MRSSEVQLYLLISSIKLKSFYRFLFILKKKFFITALSFLKISYQQFVRNFISPGWLWGYWRLLIFNVASACSNHMLALCL